MKNNNVSIMEEDSDKKHHSHIKLPAGETKSEILLYIAENGKVGTDSVRDYLRTHLNIKNKKMTYVHLSELVKLKYIIKIPAPIRTNKHGKPQLHTGALDYFSPATGFTALQSVFNYLKNHHKEKEFIKTKHFKLYVSSDEFRAKVFIYFIKEALLDLINYAKSDDAYDAFMKIAQEKQLRGHEKVLNMLRNIDISKAKYTKSTDWNKVIALSKAPNPNNIQILNSIMAIIKNTDADTIFSSLKAGNDTAKIVNYFNFLVPEKEIPEILAMVRSSPTAADYVLNFRLTPFLKQLDFRRVAEIFTKFQIGRILDNPIKIQDMLNAQNTLQWLKSLKDYSNIENKSPIYTLISLAFIYDFLHQNTAIDNDDRAILNNLLVDIFLPKIKAIQ